MRARFESLGRLREHGLGDLFRFVLGRRPAAHESEHVAIVKAKRALGETVHTRSIAQTVRK